MIQTKGMRSAGAALLAALVLGLVVHAMLGSGLDLGRAVALLIHPGVPWVVLALACEVVSYLVYGLAQRRLVHAAGGHVSARWLACLSVSAQALSNFVPAGYVAANILNFRELRHRRLGRPQVTWILVMTSVFYIGVLATLAFVGAELAGGEAARAVRDLGLAALGLMVLLALTLPALIRSRRLRARARRAAARLTQPARVDRWTERSQRFLSSISEVKLSRPNLAVCGGLFAACWIADAACLVATFQAVGAVVPWSTLLVAYCGAQLAAFIPITPGGVGLVEGSLAVVLATGGAAGIHVLSAILLYRMISYWGTLPAGAAGYAVVRRTRPESGGAERVASSGWPVQRTGISAFPSNT